jgi:uncharacterized membrane protein
MNSYLEDVRKELKDIPYEDSVEIIQYYEEYFADADMSLEEIVEKYGTPKKFAKSLKMNYFLNQDDGAMEQKAPVHAKARIHLAWLIVLSLFASPLLIPLAIGVLAVAFAVLMSIGALLIAAYSVLIAFLAGGLIMIVSGIGVVFQNPATTFVFVGAGLLLTGLGIVITPFVLKSTKWIFNKFIDFLKWIGRKITRKQQISMGGDF